MRVLFIEPKTNNPIRTNLALPVTFLSLFSYINRNLPEIDFLYHSIEIDHVENRIKNLDEINDIYNPDIVLSTSVTCNFNSAVELLDFFGRKGCFTIFGGLYATANDKDIFEKYDSIDIIIRGEGEITLHEILVNLLKNKVVSNIDGTSVLEKGRFLRNKDRVVIDDLNRLPELSFAKLPVQIFKKYNTRYYVFASRGCSYNCMFCTLTSHWQRKHRLFSHSRVLLEIEKLVSTFGAKQISFGDDTLGLDNSYFQKLCRKLAAKKFPVNFGGKIRIDLINIDLLLLLKKANFNEISFGIETNDLSQLKILGKDQIYKNIKTIDDILEVASDLGFRINMNFILGISGETNNSLARKAEFIINKCSKPNIIPLLGFLTPHPGSNLYLNLEKQGLKIIDHNLNHYNHLQPVCVPRTLINPVNELVNTYNQISSETNSERYNPLITAMPWRHNEK